jgi:hypothetical protein
MRAHVKEELNGVINITGLSGTGENRGEERIVRFILMPPHLVWHRLLRGVTFMRKVLIAVLLAGLLAVPCFAAEAPAPVSGDIVNGNEELAKYFEKSTGTFLLALGRAKQSPVLLAAAAELFGTSGAELNTLDGKKINAASVFAEAVTAAKEVGNADLASALEKQSRIGSDKGWHYGWYRDLVLSCIRYGWYYTPESLEPTGRILDSRGGDTVYVFRCEYCGVEVVAESMPRSSICPARSSKYGHGWERLRRAN